MTRPVSDGPGQGTVDAPGTTELLAGGGETGALLRAFDWAATPLGAPSSWSPEVRALVRRLLAAADALEARTVAAEDARHRADAMLASMREEAEAARQRVAFLSEASAQLAGSLDVAATLRTVASLAVPALADWCFVEIREEDGVVRPAIVVHEDPAKVALAHDVLRRYPIDIDAPFGTGHVLRTGEPELATEITDAMLASVAQDEEHARILREVGFRSSLSVPLAGPDGRAFAVLSLVSTNDARRYGPADLALVEEVARRAGAALASARLYTTGQAALRRATVLQRVTAELSAALTVEEAATVVVEQIAATLHAKGGVVLCPSADGRSLDILRFVGYPRHVLEPWPRVPVDADIPIAEAYRTCEPVFVESEDAWKRRYGARGLLAKMPESRAWAALPLIAEGRVLGVMGLSFANAGPLAPAERSFVLALSQQCAQAMERARLFEGERAARAEAERANRAKSEFLATMSHELRTPLNAIGGYAELMAMGIRGAVTAQQREDLDRIQRSQRHLLGLINEVLNYARLETGRVHYDLVDVRVATAVAAVEALVLPQVREKAITLDTSGCDPHVVARADADKLQQVLVNLLSNAVKFTAVGGRIAVACGASPARGDVVTISVQDTGVGIPADKLEAIFEPFVQVGRSLSSPGEGTGLGLAISRDLARGMHGDLAATSTVGAGSTLTLTLPRAG